MYGVKDERGGTENVERMLRRFKRVAESAGLIAEVKRRRFYEKPCEEKRRKRNEALRRAELEKMPLKKRKRRKEKEFGSRNRFDRFSAPREHTYDTGMPT